MDRSDEQDKLEKLIVEAFNSVPQEYYQLITAGNSADIVRERVFCYELYHKIRCLQEARQLMQYSIHGEIDKSGHRSFAMGDRFNPDFVFHKPGTMGENLIVIEVKGKLTNCGMCKDLRTLMRFCNKYEYGKGRWLVYNYSYKEIVQKVRRFTCKIEQGNTHCISLVCKKNADSTVEVNRLDELLRAAEI